MDLIAFFQQIDKWLWQPLFLLLVAIGLYLTYRLKGLQLRYLPYSLKLAFSRHDHTAVGDITHFQAFTTSLAATIGIGNIAGVATAIAMGGLGALFWLWVTAFIGMATKYAEGVLAIRYRVVDSKGEMAGGPMYYLRYGLGWKKLAICFAMFGALTTLATGNLVQSNSIACAISNYTGLQHWIIGLVLALSTAAVIVGGIKSIGKMTAYFVPFMALFYLASSLIVIGLHIDILPRSIALIFKSAFTGQAAAGGFVGSTMMLAMQMGLARGIFSNESGLGSSPIASAAAKTDYASRQALVDMAGAFLSTFVCTLTGLAIAVTQVLGQCNEAGELLNGAYLTVVAFEQTFPFGGLVVILASLFFGFSTIIGWSYYGEKCCEYLLGAKSIYAYRYLYTTCVFLGVAIPIDLVWPIADIANACMALPNLIALVGLSGVVVQETNLFFRIRKQLPAIDPAV